MNKIFTLFSILMLSQYSFAQIDFQWARHGEGPTNDFLNAAVTDGSGYTYITGGYSTDGIIFGNDTLDGSIATDFFLAKYDAGGNVIWAKSVSGPGSELGTGIDLDSQGNIYITGTYTQSGVIFGNDTLQNNGATDFFVAKFDTTGNILNAFGIGGTDSDNTFEIRVDGSGYSYVMGNLFSPSVDFGPVTIINQNSISDAFIVKYDPLGNFLWLQTAQDASALAADIAANGEVVFTGRLAGINIAFGNDTLSSAGGNDVYIARLNVSGNFMWAKRSGGTADDSGDGVAFDNDGNFYLTGYFKSNSITFDTHTLNCFSTLGKSDLYLVKYNTSGNAVWAVRAGNTETEEGRAIRTDNDGNVYLAGVMGPDPFQMGSTTLTSYGLTDALVAEYDSSGNVLWALHGGGSVNDEANTLGIDNSGNVYLAGTYLSSTATFGNQVLPVEGGRDVYLAKIDNTLSLPEHYSGSGKLLVYPVPADNEIYIASGAKLKNVTLFSLTGQSLLKTFPDSRNFQLNIEFLSRGIYLLRAETENGLLYSKIVKE